MAFDKIYPLVVPLVGQKAIYPHLLWFNMLVKSTIFKYLNISKFTSWNSFWITLLISGLLDAKRMK